MNTLSVVFFRAARGAGHDSRTCHPKEGEPFVPWSSCYFLPNSISFFSGDLFPTIFTLLIFFFFEKKKYIKRVSFIQICFSFISIATGTSTTTQPRWWAQEANRGAVWAHWWPWWSWWFSPVWLTPVTRISLLTRFSVNLLINRLHRRNVAAFDHKLLVRLHCLWNVGDVTGERSVPHLSWH